MPNQASHANTIGYTRFVLILLLGIFNGTNSQDALARDIVYKIASQDMHDNAAASVSDQLPLLQSMGVGTIAFPVRIEGLALTILRREAAEYNISVIGQDALTPDQGNLVAQPNQLRSILIDEAALSDLAKLIDQQVYISNDPIGPLLSYLLKDDPEADPRQTSKQILLAHAALFFLAGEPVVFSGDLPSILTNTNIRSLAFNDPILRLIAEQAELRNWEPALRLGDISIISKPSKNKMIGLLRTHGDDQLLLIFNRSDSQENFALNLPEKLKKPCLINGVRGMFARRQGTVAYAAPALSWAVYDLAGCKSRKKR